jgi:hypothetical protein
MSAVNGALRVVFDLLLAPLSGLPPVVGLTVVSAVASVFMLLVFKWTSDQVRMEAVKRRIHASLFEIRLFNDDLVNILRSSFDILRHNALYVRLTLLPLAVMTVPLVLAVAQLQFHYGYERLRPGESTLFQVELRDAVERRPDAHLTATEGVSIDAGPVWIPSRRELAWRISATGEGPQLVTLGLDGRSYTKALELSPGVARRSPLRTSPGFWNQLVYPAEDPLPAGSAVVAITVGYRDAEVGALGLEAHWIIGFLVLSLLFALAFRRPLGVVV